MAYINLLDTVGDISKKEEALNALAWAAGIEKTEIDIASINKRAEDPENFRYFTESFREVDKDDARVFYVWVDSGYLKDGIYPIYFSFMKRGIGLSGAFVGTEKHIIDYANKKRLMRNQELANSQYDSIAHNISNEDFFEELYSRLLIKDNWKIAENALANYVYAIANRLAQKVGYDNKDVCIVNKDRTKVIFNTNLLDKYGNDIYVKFNIMGNEIRYPEFIRSKADLIEEGFSKEDLGRSLKSINLYDSIDQLIFHAEEEDFDLENFERLTHVLEERIDRFPEEVRDLPLEILCSKLISAIKLAIRISKRDIRYVIPTYCIHTGEIQFLIPFHVIKSLNEKPELAIVVNKKNGFYAVMTVLPLAEAYANHKTITPYSDEWIHV